MGKKKKRFYDPFFYRLFTTLGNRWHLGFQPSQSRWQLIILLVTADFLAFSTGLAFCLTQLSIGENIQMTHWFLIIGLVFIGISIFGLAFIWILVDYFRRNPREEHVSIIIKRTKNELVRDLGAKLDQVTKAINRVNETLIGRQNNDGEERAKAPPKNRKG